MFVSSGIRALDLRAMATDDASGAQGAKIAEISPAVHGVQTFRAETTAQISKLRDSLERDREDMAALRTELTARFDALMARLEPAENPSLRFGCFGSLPPPSDSPVARVRGTTPSSTDGSPLSMFMGNSASSRSKAPQSGPLPTPASYCAPLPHRFPSNQNQWVPLPQAVHVISSPSSPPPQPNPHPPQPQTPSTMIINGHPLPHQFPGVSQTHSLPHHQYLASLSQQPLYHPPTSPTGYQSAQPLAPNSQNSSHHPQYSASHPQQPLYQHPPSVIIGQSMVSLSPLPLLHTAHAMAESPSSAHMRYHQPLPINCDFTQNMKHDQQHFSSNHDCDGVGSMFGVELSGIDANFAKGMGESCDKKVGINSRERRELRQRENISVEKDGHGLSMFVKRREYCAPHLFEKMPKSDELCNTVRINSVLMSTHDKDGRTEELNVESYLGAESYEGHLSPKTVAMRKQLWELISKPNSSFGVSEPNLESPGDSMKGQLGLSHCYITLKATAESEFLIVSETPPITVHQLRAPLLKFERQLHYEIIDFVVLANDYSKLAFFSADCSPFPHENYRQHCSLWNSILGKVMVCDCWSCALLFAAPYDTLVAQIKNGALYRIDTILQFFPDIVRDNRRSVLVDVGGATLLMVELNRVLRVRGSFVRSAIPAYHKFHADIGIRGAMSEFTKSNCWDLMVLRTDGPKKVVVVLFWNPSTPERYNARARSFVTADPLFTGSSMIVLGYSDEPIVCVSQVFSCQLASESFTSCYMSMEIAMMKASHPPKVVIATNCQQLTISIVQIDAYHHSDPSLMVVSVHSFSFHYRNNEPLFVISCNERKIVRSPQRVIPTSKMEGDSVTLLVHVDPSLIFETEKNHNKGCSKTHMLESTQRRLMLLQESVLLKAASPRVLRTHPLVLPSDNSIHPNLACILSKHHSLVVEAAIMMRQFFTSAVLYTRICSTDFLMNISEFYPLRYSSDPLENGVVWMTYMQKTFQTDHKEEPLVTASSSNFNSPTHAIVRKLVSLLIMVAIHSSPPLRDNILREDGCCPFFLGNTMVIYINEQLSLKSKKQGLDIGYGVYNGNYSSPVSSSLHLSDFMITRLIAFGFGAMDFGDLALVPHKLFSILMWSNEAFLVILLSASIHFRLLVFVIASHLLHCPTREALQIISIMQHLHDWQSTSYPPESVHLSALIHTWQVTTRDGIDFGAALTTILASVTMHFCSTARHSTIGVIGATLVMFLTSELVDELQCVKAFAFEKLEDKFH